MTSGNEGGTGTLQAPSGVWPMQPVKLRFLPQWLLPFHSALQLSKLVTISWELSSIPLCLPKAQGIPVTTCRTISILFHPTPNPKIVPLS